MSKEIITELSKKEIDIIKKYIKLKKEEKKNKENIDSLKDHELNKIKEKEDNLYKSSDDEF